MPDPSTPESLGATMPGVGEFTPGPWCWIGGMLFGPTIGDDPNAGLSSETKYNADDDYEYAYIEVSDTNANLIAAAPCLYAYAFVARHYAEHHDAESAELLAKATPPTEDA